MPPLKVKKDNGPISTVSNVPKLFFVDQTNYNSCLICYLQVVQKPDCPHFTDQIFFQIARSRFVVADFTHGAEGARGGVYFEAGYAKGLGIPIIWCIRDDDVSKMHFDTDHYPHVTWTDSKDLREKLATKVRGFLGEGPLHG